MNGWSGSKGQEGGSSAALWGDFISPEAVSPCLASRESESSTHDRTDRARSLQPVWARRMSLSPARTVSITWMRSARLAT